MNVINVGLPTSTAYYTTQEIQTLSTAGNNSPKFTDNGSQDNFQEFVTLVCQTQVIQKLQKYLLFFKKESLSEKAHFKNDFKSYKISKFPFVK